MGFISETVKLKMKIGVTLAGIVAIGALSFFCYRSGMNRAELAMAQAKPQITATTLSQQLSDIEELAVLEYNYTTMGQFENSNNFYGVKLPFTTKKFVVSYDGVIKAGVDLSQINITVNGNEINVGLPKASILSHQVFEDSLQIYDEKNGLFNPLSITDFNEFYMSQKDEMEKKVIEKGILSKASDKAKTAVSNIIEKVAGEEYIVSVIEK